MDKKVIHVQSDPPPPRFVGKSAPLRSGNQPPLNPVIFPCNVLPVIEPPFLGKPSLLAGAGRPSIALPQGRVVLPKAPSPPPMAAPRHGACRPPPAHLWPAAPLRGLNGHAGTPAKAWQLRRKVRRRLQGPKCDRRAVFVAGQGMSREKAKNALQARKKGPPGPWYLSGYFVGPPL